MRLNGGHSASNCPQWRVTQTSSSSSLQALPDRGCSQGSQRVLVPSTAGYSRVPSCSSDHARELWKKAFFKLKVARVIRKLGEDIVTFGTTELIQKEDANFYQFLYHNVQKVRTFKTLVVNEVKVELRNQRLIHPDSAFRRCWDILLSLLLIYTSTVMPYTLAFRDTQFWDAWTVLDLCVDLLFTCDIILSFFSSYTNPSGTVETSRRKVILGYLKGWFVLDLVACVPAGLIDYIWPEREDQPTTQYNRLIRITRLPRLYRLLRLARIAKLLRFTNSAFFEDLKETLRINSRKRYTGLYKLLKFLVIESICVHLMGCLWYFSAKIDSGNLNTWVVRYDCQDAEKFTLYLRSIYWAITTLLTVGYGDIAAGTQIEMVLTVMWMVIGVGFYSYTVGSLSSFLLSIDTRETQLLSKIAAAQEFTKVAELSKPLRSKVKSAIKYHALTKGRSDKHSLFADLPLALQYEVSTHMYGGVVTEFPFFSKRSKGFCVFFIPLFKPMRLCDSEVLYKRGDYADAVYFIIKGRVNLVLNYRQVAYKSYIRKSYIGEIEVIQHISRIDTVVTLGNCELLSVAKDQFWRALSEFPEYSREIAAVAGERHRRHMDAYHKVMQFIRPRVRRDSIIFLDDEEEKASSYYETSFSAADVVARLGRLEDEVRTMKAELRAVVGMRSQDGGYSRGSKSPLSRTQPISHPSKEFPYQGPAAAFDGAVDFGFQPYGSRNKQEREREKLMQASAAQKVLNEEKYRQIEAEKAAIELAKEIKSDEEKAAQKLRWTKKTSKLATSLPPSQYYTDLPIKPGFFFLQTLILAPKALLKTLKLRIPDTLYYGNKLWFVHTDESGSVGCEEGVTCVDFLKRLERDRVAEPKVSFDFIAAILRRRGSNECDIVKHILDWNQFRNKMLVRDIVEGCMLQRFVRSVGGKASVIRLQYHPHARDNKANIAYFLSNVRCESPNNFYRCVVNLDAVDSFEIFQLRGASIKEIERTADIIVEYISRGYNVRIEEIHLDFLKDGNGVLWFCGCRGFRLDAVSLSRSLSPISRLSPSDQQIEAQIASDRKSGRFVRCKLCRLHYQNQELPHLISVRMLLVYKTHISKRVDLPLNIDHLKLVTADLLSQSVRVCELCFMLITSEFQLIETEKKLAAAMHIQPREEELEEDPAHTMQLQFLPKKLVQWRILLYFRCIDKPAFLGFTPLRLTVEVCDSTTHFDVLIDPDSAEIAVNRVKLLYFFASPEKSIRRFLSEARMQIGVWQEGEKVALGESLLLCHFPSSLKTGTALTQSRVLTLFSPSCATSFDLMLSVGLSCDRYYHSKYLKTLLTKVSDVYLPEPNYFNGTPLPVDWMEQFGETHIDHSFKADIAPEDFYECTISREELRRMESGEDKSSRSLSRSKARTPGLPPLSYRTTSTHRMSARLPDVPSLDLSSFAANNDQTVKDLIFTVNGYLRDRPKSALSTSAQDRSRSISKTARTVTIEEVPKKPRRPRAKRDGSYSSMSTRRVSPAPSLRSFREHYKEIERCVGQDLKAFGEADRRGVDAQRTWTESYGDSEELNDC